MRTTSTGSDQAAHPPTFTLFAVAEMRGQIGPCGCTSDPLGDISRTTELVDEARRAGPVIVVDAGSLLYSQNPIPAQLKDQEELKANLLQAIYRDQLHVAAVGLGPADLANGKQSIRLPREAADVTDPQVPLEPPKLIDAGTAKVGVFGVVAPDAVTGVTVGDPVAAGKAAIRELRGKGAQVIVGLVQAPNKHDAAQLVKAIGGIDFAIAGLGLNAPEPNDTPIEGEKLGDTWLVIPGNRGQVVSRIDVTLDAASPGAAGFVDAIGSGGAAAKIAALDKRLADTDADLARFAADKDADPKFVAATKVERDQLAAQRVELQKHPLVTPAHGSYFTLDQIKINKMLACNAPVQTAIADYDRQSGEANVKAAASQPPLPIPPGEATYVGKGQCSDCHQEQVDFWKTTVHSHAWQTLVDRGQQYDLSCFGCHVTGSDRPGGASLAKNENLRDVQCEVCHGPGSIHVAKGGNEKPIALVTSPPIDLCATQCHTKEHSDTFQYEAYLRDITGKGHAEKLHQKLGDGPTGHSLRSAALDKAGHAIGKGCTK
nr:multiheme c-type cytochrome [Kofleriaceae bacterium]